MLTCSCFSWRQCLYNSCPLIRWCLAMTCSRCPTSFSGAKGRMSFIFLPKITSLLDSPVAGLGLFLCASWAARNLWVSRVSLGPVLSLIILLVAYYAPLVLWLLWGLKVVEILCLTPKLSRNSCTLAILYTMALSVANLSMTPKSPQLGCKLFGSSP